MSEYSSVNSFTESELLICTFLAAFGCVAKLCFAKADQKTLRGTFFQKVRQKTLRGTLEKKKIKKAMEIRSQSKIVPRYQVLF